MNNLGWALITGASSGIGREFARLFAADGIDVILVARDSKGLDKYSAELQKSYGIKAYAITCDLSDKMQSRELIEYIKKQDINIEFLINNAGVGDYAPIIEADWDRIASMIRLNVLAVTYLTHSLLPDMVRRGGGKVVNVASTAAFLPGPNMAAYYASKAYVKSFSESIAEEVKGNGISVTILSPGPTKTHFADTANATNTRIFRASLPSAEAVAKFGYGAMWKGKLHAVHGLSNRLMLFVIRFIPARKLGPWVRRTQG